MDLWKDNKFKWHMDDERVISSFVESPVYRENARPENIKFALFLAYQEPAGLQSTTNQQEFNRVFDLFQVNKHKLL